MPDFVDDNPTYERLRNLTLPQLVAVVENLNLDSAFIHGDVAAIIAADVCKLAKQRYGRDWEEAVKKVVIGICGADVYWEEKLGHIKDFLVKPPEHVIVSKEHGGTVAELRKSLKKRKELQEPALIKVRGTLFPAALLTAGWWEATKSYGNIPWRNPQLQQWLFEGFDLWAPSWEISWDFEGLGKQGKWDKPYYAAQLTMGDEADSLAVVLPPGWARELAPKFKKNHGVLQAEITGVIGHRHQANVELEGKVSPGNPMDYCIWLKDGEAEHDVADLERPHLYSGYLWKCVVPRRWLEDKAAKGENIGLSDVYIVWEHTNFAADRARNYNLAALKFKEQMVAQCHRKDGGLVLLQKSHWLVPGKPEWRAEDFYRLMVERKTVSVPDRLKQGRPGWRPRWL